MDQDEAREAKAHALEVARTLSEAVLRPSTTTASVVPLSVGLAPCHDGSYGIALRYRLGLPEVRSIARQVAAQIGEVGKVVDLRRTGRIRALTGGVTPGTDVGTEGAAVPGPRPPVVTAQALGETGRVRPLRPGVSIAHVDVTAGTLGAFVLAGGAVHALSNHHVLVGSPSGRRGDDILQPGPADGGRTPGDRVGTLAAFVPLESGRTARVDAALALLDDQDVDATYPVGRVTTTARARGGELVGKIGRTTSVTTGRVTAIELDDVVVGYGEELGNLRFDDQVEIEGISTAPFSRGGDSGSLVYREDGVALGLLFAGSEVGGDNGRGLTYVNPIDAVLGALDATLLA
ncbi:S1 family peptidase [Cellulomonas xiejunii]|uniref:S1 family peptidase n=1 Tax=Cellulomonas xiejunii TaxID=2968083 RepID=A0ABY5KPB0_9CELL|nr:S1 family peptidase [Cellulomonas xiejunii]MCC2321516.1 S1 family peptidase [Cellulomonas xiejunii]MCC2323332.1 S1 family peptidase [Cellulomonas xiejunii]UUI72089.1 S1 family peptidase [Cellulomonas xiejunii]